MTHLHFRCRLLAYSVALIGTSAGFSTAFANKAPVNAKTFQQSFPRSYGGDVLTSGTGDGPHCRLDSRYPGFVICDVNKQDTTVNLYPGDVVGRVNYYGNYLSFWMMATSGSKWLSETYETSLLNPGHLYWLAYTNNAGNTNMNEHGAKADTWNISYINQTRQPIVLGKRDAKNWNGNNLPVAHIIPPCQTYTLPASSYTMPGENFGNSKDTYKQNEGFLGYNFSGAYTGSAWAVANYPWLPGGSLVAGVNILVTDAQASSGSGDWIGLSGGVECRTGQEFNCVQTLFAPPKNVATSYFEGGHTYSLRRFSTNVRDVNTAYIQFKPKSNRDNDICPLSEEGVNAYIQSNFPSVVLKNRNKIFLSANGKSLEQNYPNWNKNLINGGVFITGWGATGSLPLATNFLTPQVDKITITQIDAPVVNKVIESYSSNELVNNSDKDQTLSTASFSKSTKNSSSTETKSVWDTTMSHGVNGNVSGTTEVGVPGLGKAGITISIGYNFEYSSKTGGEQAVTCSQETDITVSAPSQSINVPAHTKAVATWQLTTGKTAVTLGFKLPIKDTTIVAGAMAGQFDTLTRQWQNPGLYQTFNSDIEIVKPQLFYTNLYTLLAPAAGIALPPNLSWNDKTKTFELVGTTKLTASNHVGINMEVKLYPLNKDGTVKPDVDPIIENIDVPNNNRPKVQSMAMDSNNTKCN